MAGDPTGFVVTDLAGPLLRGELDRATAWGREVATTAQSHLAARAAGSRSTGTTR
jgi:hypothetical protein